MSALMIASNMLHLQRQADRLFGADLALRRRPHAAAEMQEVRDGQVAHAIALRFCAEFLSRIPAANDGADEPAGPNPTRAAA